MLLDGLALASGIVADRGDSAKGLIDSCAGRRARTHSPARRNVRVRRTVAPDLCRPRNLVERRLNTLEPFRRVATRFDKLPTTSWPPLLWPPRDLGYGRHGSMT